MTGREKCYNQDAGDCHILDMTIADPPMEEIIADIYGHSERLSQETP